MYRYLCLSWVTPVEYLHKPPSLSFTEELIVSLALGCFPGRSTGSFMKCQGDRSTWPTLCCVRVSSETADALRWQFRGFAREQASVDSCQFCSSSLLCTLWCEAGCVAPAYTGLGLWSVRAREWWEHRTMNQTRLMIWMFTVCGDLTNCVRRRSDWCSMKHKETICFGGQAWVRGLLFYCSISETTHQHNGDVEWFMWCVVKGLNRILYAVWYSRTKSSQP